VQILQVPHLFDDDLEEGETMLGRKKRLRPGHPHAGPEPAVELQYEGVPKRRLSGAPEVRQPFDLVHVGWRPDLRRADHPSRTIWIIDEGLIVASKRFDRHVWHVSETHLRFEW
jgi:hypothetical protein